MLRLILIALIISPVVRADELDVARAKAAIALAKAQRERETAKLMTEGGCHLSLENAQRMAKTERKPLVMWVGMECKDSPVVRDALTGAVHAHIASFHGDTSPRIVFTVGDSYYQYSRDQVTRCPECVAETIRRMTGLAK